MKTCPYCANHVSDIARTCTMCGMGLPANLPQRSRILPVIVAAVLIGGLAVASFFAGEWRARHTPLVAVTPTADPPTEHRSAPRPRPSQPTDVVPPPAPGPVPSGRR